MNVCTGYVREKQMEEGSNSVMCSTVQWEGAETINGLSRFSVLHIADGQMDKRQLKM
jgi:hypothetical protein